MFSSFISHLSKKFSRSASADKETATAIFLGILVVVVVGYSLAFGFALESIITSALKQSKPIDFLNGLMIYYFASEFLMRYFLQSLPVMDVQPYLHLPVAKSKIVHFLLGRSLLNVMNTFVFLLFTPFALTAIANVYGAGQAWIWLVSLWLVSLINHWLIVLFKKKFDDNIWGLLVLVMIVGTLAASDYFGWFQLSTLSQKLFNISLHGYTSIVALVISQVGLYMLAYLFFSKSLYTEDLLANENQNYYEANLAFLKNFGSVGEWISIELKLILRHKRGRTVLVMNLFFLLYGLFFYRDPSFSQNLPGIVILIGILMTGIFVMNYGQFLFSWQGSHFDFILTQPVSLVKYIESKYWLMAAVTCACFLLSIPYVYFGWSMLLVHLAAALFNMGINIFIVMNMAMWDPKKIDLSKGSALNYEGIGAAQWLMGLPVMLAPFVFYLPFSLAGHPMAGLAAVGTAGLLGILFRRKLIQVTAKRLEKRRYVIASNFRKE